MELTGKCKDAFDKWYIDYIKHKRRDYIKFSHEQILQKFYREIDSMRYGVYVDFFDSFGIFIQISFYDFDGFNWQMCLECTDSDFDYNETHLVSRQEARIEAIKKANEIFNND